MLSFGEVQTARDWFKGVPGTESFADVPQSLSTSILSSEFPIHMVALDRISIKHHTQSGSVN